MILLLTSSPTGDLDGKYIPDGIDNRNGFLDELKRYWKEDTRCLIASATPDDEDRNHEFADFLYHAFQRSGLSCACVNVLETATMGMTKEEIHSYDLIVLGGGHVPTQNAFFQKIGLREKLKEYDGIILGISAGSMNAADVVYSQPEEVGEAIDPDYRRFFPGLGLTKINVLPHYQIFKDSYLDGMRLYEEITYPDSEGRLFVAIPDGSYLVIKGKEIHAHGMMWRIHPHGRQEVHG